MKAVVTRLERSGLLVRAPGPDGWCKLHALVRRFAAERWPLDDAEFRELHRSAATWFEAREAWQEALRSWQAAGEWDAVSTLLSKCGPQLVEEGSTDLLLDAVEKLPDRLRGSDVLELAGEALHRRGDWQGALSYYTVAASSKEALPAGLARRLARLHFLREEFDEAFRIYERAEGSEG